MAYDEAANVSSSSIVIAKPVDNGQRDTIANFIVNLITNKEALLNWDYISDPDLAGYQIFRAINQDPMRPFKYISWKEAAYWGNVDYVLSGNREFGWMDEDIQGLPVLPNPIVIGPQLNVNSATLLTVVNPINPNAPLQIPANRTIISYQIMAKFVDGGYSPMTQIMSIVLP